MAHAVRTPNCPLNTQVLAKSSRPRLAASVALGSQFLGVSELKKHFKNQGISVKGPSFKVAASVATAEKPSKVPEIVLQPIKEISGAVKLPGSKSLSNRVLLLAALSEVKESPFCFVGCVGGSRLFYRN